MRQSQLYHDMCVPCRTCDVMLRNSFARAVDPLSHLSHLPCRRYQKCERVSYGNARAEPLSATVQEGSFTTKPFMAYRHLGISASSSALGQQFLFFNTSVIRACRCGPFVASSGPFVATLGPFVATHRRTLRANQLI